MPKYDKDALLVLHAQGLSPRQISRQTGIPRSTIDRYVRDAGQSRPRAKSLTKVSEDGQTLKLCSECKRYISLPKMSTSLPTSAVMEAFTQLAVTASTPKMLRALPG